MTIEDLNSSLESETASDIPVAKRYYSRIEVKNIGNMPALNAEIYLDKLEYIPKDSTISQNIECSGAALNWNGSESHTIIIPPGGKKLIKIVKPPLLTIGEIENNKETAKGKWTATFSLYAQNLKPISFTVEIEWNGIWKTRLTEFKKLYKIAQKI
jgi:hypothetical protein